MVRWEKSRRRHIAPSTTSRSASRASRSAGVLMLRSSGALPASVANWGTRSQSVPWLRRALQSAVIRALQAKLNRDPVACLATGAIPYFG